MNPVLTLKPADADSPEPSGIKSEEPAKEHFNISESGEKLNALPEMENMTFKDIYPVDVKSPPFTTTEEMLNYIPNASVIFIHDLKIANYTNYYFKNSENIDIRDNSLSPQFANKEESGSLSKQLQDRDYYAHEIIKDAMEAFNKKQFTVCIDLLDLLHGYNKNDTNAQFYLGMCFYHLGDYNKALKYFTSASDNNINIFLLEAEFYTALCYKNTNKINEANELFKQIINKNLFYAKRAAEELK